LIFKQFYHPLVRKNEFNSKITIFTKPPPGVWGQNNPTATAVLLKDSITCKRPFALRAFLPFAGNVVLLKKCGFHSY
jgi:hypothetical protein